MPKLEWLPALILLADSGGDWTVYLSVLYLMFKKDFLDSVPVFEGTPLRLKSDPMKEGKEATFWHLISEGDDEQNRRIEESRCERIRWPRSIIEKVPSAEIHRWESVRGRETRVVLALGDYSYVVVLARRSGYLLPWTAYNVEREHRRRKLKKEHEEFLLKNTEAAT